jgi:histone H3/H4
MSLLDRNCIRVIAESVGVSSVSDEVADALAPDIEYRLRDIVAEALKFMRHGRRETLSCDDINFALRARSCEPLYGFASTDIPRFCRAAGTSDVYYLDDPELNLSDLMAVPLPPMPRPPTFTAHWLAINGVQPDIAQNPTPAEAVAAAEIGSTPSMAGKRKRGSSGAGVEGGGPDDPTEALGPAEQALTAEEQVWLESVFETVRAIKLNDEKRSRPTAANTPSTGLPNGDVTVAAGGPAAASSPQGSDAMEVDGAPVTGRGAGAVPGEDAGAACFHPGGWAAVHASRAAGIFLKSRAMGEASAGANGAEQHEETEEAEAEAKAAREEALVAVLKAVATETSMHAYAAYFAPFVAREVNANLTCLPLLTALIRFTQVCTGHACNGACGRGEGPERDLRCEGRERRYEV